MTEELVERVARAIGDRALGHDAEPEAWKFYIGCARAAITAIDFDHIRLAERERCAMIAESYVEGDGADDDFIAHSIYAAIIRAK